MAGKGLNQNIYKSFPLAYHQRINKAINYVAQIKKSSHLHAPFRVGMPVYLLQMSRAQVDMNVLNCEMRNCRKSGNVILRRNL
jgi:hypothetical protein